MLVVPTPHFAFAPLLAAAVLKRGGVYIQLNDQEIRIGHGKACSHWGKLNRAPAAEPLEW